MLLWHLPSVQPDSHQMSHLRAREPLAVLSGHISGSLTSQEWMLRGPGRGASGGHGQLRRKVSACRGECTDHLSPCSHFRMEYQLSLGWICSSLRAGVQIRVFRSQKGEGLGVRGSTGSPVSEPPEPEPGPRESRWQLPPWTYWMGCALSLRGGTSLVIS